MRRDILFGVAFVFLATCFGDANAQLDKSRFAELMELVVPGEKTDQIEWLPDLLSAQKAALEQDKPIFIWSMDGHPLGCV